MLNKRYGRHAGRMCSQTATRRGALIAALLLSWVGAVSANQAPVPGPVPPAKRAEVDRALLYRWPADLFTDPDGDDLTVTVDMADGSPWPNWLEANPDDRTLSGVFPTGQITTTLVFHVRAEDPGGLSATNRISVELVRPPVELVQDFYLDGNANNRVITHTRGMNNFSGWNNRHLTYSLDGSPAGLWIDPHSGFLAFSPVKMKKTKIHGPCGEYFTEYTDVYGVGECLGPHSNDVFASGSEGFFTVKATDGFTEAQDRGHYLIWQAPTTLRLAPGETFQKVIRPDPTFEYYLPFDQILCDGNNPTTFYIEQTSTEALPDWLHFDPATGRFYGTNDVCFKIMELFLHATDWYSGDCHTFGITLTFQRDPVEVSTPTPGIYLAAGTSTNLSFASTFSYLYPTSLVMSASRESGDPLPDWMTFDAEAMTLDMAPDANVNAIVAVEILAEDPCGYQAVDDFTVQVFTPKPEQQNPLLNQTWIGGQTGSYTFHPDTFVSPEGLALTYTVELDDGDDLPGWLTFDDSTRTFSGTPPDFNDRIEILVTARDTRGAMTDDTLILTVHSGSSPPGCPSGSDEAISLGVNQTQVFAHADFPLADTDRSLHRLRVAGLPAQGALALSGVVVTNGAVVTADNLFDGLFTFAPDADETGDPYTSFGFVVHDGHQEGCSTNTMTLSVSGAAPAAMLSTPADTGGSGGGASDGYDLETMFHQRDTRCFPHWMSVQAGQTGEVDVLEDVFDMDVDRYGETVTLLGVTQPAHGSVTVISNGLVRYVNDGLSLEDDHFTYTAGTATGQSHTSDVHVRVHHPRSGTQPPVITNTTLITTGISPIVLRPEEFAMDPDGFGELRFRDWIDPVRGSFEVASDHITYYPDVNAFDPELVLLIEDAGLELAVARLTVIMGPNPDPEAWLRGGDQTFDTFLSERELQGGCNTSAVGRLTWSNQVTQETGDIPVATAWTITLHEAWAGASDLTLSVSNLAGTVSDRTYTLTQPAPEVTYAAPGGLHQYPFTSWESAATQLQDAVDVVMADGLILVSNGVYSTGGHRNYTNGNFNRITLGDGKRMQSINGPSVTVIGGATNVRCAYLSGGASLSGFTVMNGHVDDLLGSDQLEHTRGGGIFIDHDGVVSNCVIRSNDARQDGGGIFLYGGGEVVNTLFTDNFARYGGGVYHMAGGMSRNCTIVSNEASSRGAGIFFNDGNSTSVNSIIRYNVIPGGGGTEIDWAMNEPSELRYCNTIPLPSGPGCFTNEPLFANTTTWELDPLSPCIDAGDPILGTKNDFNDRPRPLDGGSGTAVPDLGIYEHLVEGRDSDWDDIPDTWEIDHGMNPNEHSDAMENPDGDRFLSRCEYVADTDPYDPDDNFRVLHITPTEVWFMSSAERLYTLEKTPSLTDPAWAPVPGQGPRRGLGGDDLMAITNMLDGSEFFRVRVELP